MSDLTQARDYRDKAESLRANAAKASSEYIRKDMEAAALRYELLAEGIEEVAKTR